MPFNMFGQDEEEVDPSNLNIVAQPLPVGVGDAVKADHPAQQAPGYQIENPMVKDYMQKAMQNVYGDKLSDASRQKLVDANKEDESGLNWQAALASLGAGIAGKDADAAGNDVINNQQRMRAQKLEDFDKQRAGAVKNYELGRALKTNTDSDELLAQEKDPASAQSKLAQQAALKLGVKPEIANALTAEQFKAQGPLFEKIYAVEQKKLDRQEGRETRNLAQKEKLDEKMQGLQTPYGIANTIDDAKKLKEAHESKGVFDSKIGEMIALRQKHGGGAVWDREDVARGKQLSKDLLLEYKNMAKLGVLSKSDEDIINKIIPEDPLAFKAAGLIGQDPILTTLQKFKGDSDKDFATRIATRTRAGLKDYAAGKGPRGGGDKNVVRMRDPRGVVRLIPADQVAAATAAGGSIVDDEKVAQAGATDGGY